MAERILKFPPGFLWGASTSAYQIEGGIDNADWSKVFPAGQAVDHWNRWREDFDLLLKLNLNAYRMSVEWSRIEPKEGQFNQIALWQYREMLKYLKNNGLKTFLTLHHFTTPQWLAKKSWWEDKKIVGYFEKFCQKIFEELGELVDFWQTINEPLIYSELSYREGRWPPKKKNFFSFLRVLKNQISAHLSVYDLFHRLNRKVKVGIALNYSFLEPKNQASFLDQFSVAIVSYLKNSLFLNRISAKLDFIGLNYYFHDQISFPFRFNLVKPKAKDPEVLVSDIGWEVYPKGIYYVLKKLKRYNLPIYITENGVADSKDKLRTQFIKEHLYWVWRAIQEGVDVRGYLHWSLLDNFEWDKGFEPRFGLVEVDYQNNYQRKIRESAYFYSQIAKNNSLLVKDKIEEKL